MANYKGHLVGGCVGYAFLWYVLASRHPSLLTSAEWLMCALMGSLFPDVDIKSKGQKYFYTFILFSFTILILQQKLAVLSYISILILLPLLTKHRGLFHHVGFVIGMPLFLWGLVSLINPCYKNVLFFDMLFFMVGQLSHLWLDMGIQGIFYQIVGKPKRKK